MNNYDSIHCHFKEMPIGVMNDKIQEIQNMQLVMLIIKTIRKDLLYKETQYPLLVVEEG